MRNRFVMALFLELLVQVSSPLSPLLALQTYPLVNHEKTEVAISKDQPNRIAVKGDRIHQIFGAEGAFEVQTDEETGQIFVKCLCSGAGKPLTLTLITESGLTHDLTLIPKAIGFQSFLLDPQTSATPQEHKPVSYVQHLAHLMKAMAQREHAEGFTRKAFQGTSRTYPAPLTLKPSLRYQGAQEEGFVYLLKNEGSTPLSLSESVLALPQDRALSLGKTCLNPGEETDLLILAPLRSQP
jgi:type-F conjugative transfer system secretin TraK